ncbi:MAG: Transcriptional regulator, AraC family [Candidatus Uhrbacteria bacterium GW2011_GWF2_39_13]|uniref:Transcriptional regulator, AraC family n=1 Tax=Candidatus Uhrbacteria bacterium GW2011_GWF2_39_13 TaxID=1618995 RepID=A0A0G0MVF4_9BACT|nr:MAG: Transcriptional regulator, AraC family [Candidatus Uhrbacteria bacterium GW2011_GWF2_39_13]
MKNQRILKKTDGYDPYDINSYIRWLCKKYGIWISVKDLYGFSSYYLCRLDDEFRGHACPFCVYVKSFQRLREKCYEERYAATVKSGQVKVPFSKSCYMGLGEIVVPVIKDNLYMGNIAFGHFDTFKNDKGKKAFLEKISTENNADVKKLTKFYKQSAIQSLKKLGEIIPHIQNLAFIFSIAGHSMYKMPDKNLQQIESLKNNDGMKKISRQEWLVNEAVKYIKDNFRKNISLSEIAKNIYLSPGYLSMLFNKITRTSCSLYINRVRIETARKLLSDTSVPISKITFEVGFNDSNYFSKVFSDTVGVSPTEYRRKYQ